MCNLAGQGPKLFVEPEVRCPDDTYPPLIFSYVFRPLYLSLHVIFFSSSFAVYVHVPACDESS